jgi:NitT/TauT family transport system permease protein
MKTFIQRVAPGLGACILAVIVWGVAIPVFNVPTYLVPTPLMVGKALWQMYVGGTIYPDLWATIEETVLGYVIGCSLALVCGALLAESRLIERTLMPLIVGLQAMPKVALAPLLMVWFGLGISSKLILVSLVCFFPVFITTLASLKVVNRDLVNLYRALSSPRLRIFTDVKLPGAATPIFSSLQVSIVLAPIGAIVGEFVGSKNGLGNVIQSASLNLDVATMFATVLTLSVIGVAASYLVQWIEHRVIFWERPTSTKPVRTAKPAA